MERRLEAPMQGLMNAITAAFPAYKGRSFKPMWKTLTVTDRDGAWLGRVQYARRADRSTQEVISTAGDWSCTFLIPEEMSKQIKQAWAKIWTEQKNKQIELSAAEEEALSQGQIPSDYKGKR